jgi:hypothetical protein
MHFQTILFTFVSLLVVVSSAPITDEELSSADTETAGIALSTYVLVSMAASAADSELWTVFLCELIFSAISSISINSSRL